MPNSSQFFRSCTFHSLNLIFSYVLWPVSFEFGVFSPEISPRPGRLLELLSLAIDETGRRTPNYFHCHKSTSMETNVFVRANSCNLRLKADLCPQAKMPLFKLFLSKINLDFLSSLSSNAKIRFSSCNSLRKWFLTNNPTKSLNIGGTLM